MSTPSIAQLLEEVDNAARRITEAEMAAGQLDDQIVRYLRHKRVIVTGVPYGYIKGDGLFDNREHLIKAEAVIVSVFIGVIGRNSSFGQYAGRDRTEKCKIRTDDGREWEIDLRQMEIVFADESATAPP